MYVTYVWHKILLLLTSYFLILSHDLSRFNFLDSGSSSDSVSLTQVSELSNKSAVWVITAIIAAFLRVHKLGPCEKAEATVRRFSMPLFHSQSLSSIRAGSWPRNLPSTPHHPTHLNCCGGKMREGERERKKDLTCGSDTGYRKQRKFFRPTSFQSTIRAWIVVEFKHTPAHIRKTTQWKHGHHEIERFYTLNKEEKNSSRQDNVEMPLNAFFKCNLA